MGAAARISTKHKWSPNAALRVPELREAWSENCAPTAIAGADQGHAIATFASSLPRLWIGVVFSSFDAPGMHGLPVPNESLAAIKSAFPFSSSFLLPLTPFSFCSRSVPCSAAMTLPSLLTSAPSS